MISSATYWHTWGLGRSKHSGTAIIDCRNVKALMDHPWVIDRDELDWRETRIED